MRHVTMQKGYIKLWRLGPIEFGEQSRWSARAPQKRGLWAFPYPYFDMFFAYHKYTDLIPKRFRVEGADYEEREEWIRKVGRKILPIREFWYDGDLYSHFMPNGEIGNPGVFGETEWSVISSSKLGDFIQSSGGRHELYRYDPDGPLERIRTSVDHLEVFIAPNMGRIREGSPNSR